MSKFYNRISRSIRKRYIKIFPPAIPIPPKRDMNPEQVSRKIYEALQSDSPCMIARFGGIEINCVCNYLGIIKPNFIQFIRGIGQPWWWEPYTMETMKNNAGFFSNTSENLSKFAQMMIQDTPLVDILASGMYY